MDNRRLAGPGAGAVKYDVLTALTVAGLNGDPGFQISMARLISLITARYNWRGDTLSIGQKEMASLWGVGERTAKREVKRWLEAGLLICTKPGVRGRVASYSLSIPGVCAVTKPIWERVGSDFAERMSLLEPEGGRVIRLETIRPNSVPDERQKGRGWDAVLAALANRYPTQFDAWLAPLTARMVSDRLVISARSVFAAEYVKTHFGRDIVDAIHAEWGQPIAVSIEAQQAQIRAETPI